MSKVMLSIEGTPEELARVLSIISGQGAAITAPTADAPQEMAPAQEMEAPAATEEKPKRTRRTKAEIEAAQAQEAAPAAPAKEYSQEEVRAKLVAVSQKFGSSDPVKAKIAEMYEGKGFGQLGKDDYPALVEWLDNEMAA